MTKKELQRQIEQCIRTEVRRTNLYNENNILLEEILIPWLAKEIIKGRSALDITLMEDKKPVKATLWYALFQSETLLCNLRRVLCTQEN